jgi:hypothetical protein
MVTPRVEFQHPLRAFTAWVSRLHTPADDLPTVGELSQRAVEAFLGRDGAQRVAVEQAARAYQHSTARRDDPQVHTHALVPSAEGIVDFDDLNTSRLVIEVDPDQPWSWPAYQRWTAEDAETAVREQAAQSRQLAAAWGRLARERRLTGRDASVCERYQQHFQRDAEPEQARQRAERVLGLRPDPITDCTAGVEELDRSRGRGWSM